MTLTTSSKEYSAGIASCGFIGLNNENIKKSNRTEYRHDNQPIWTKEIVNQKYKIVKSAYNATNSAVTIMVYGRERTRLVKKYMAHEQSGVEIVGFVSGWLIISSYSRAYHYNYTDASQLED